MAIHEVVTHLGQTTRGKEEACARLENRLAKEQREWAPEKTQMDNFLKKIQQNRVGVKKRAPKAKEKNKTQQAIDKTIKIPLDKLDDQLKGKGEKLPFLFGFTVLFF